MNSCLSAGRFLYSSLDLGLLADLECIVDLHPEVSNGAFKLAMAHEVASDASSIGQSLLPNYRRQLEPHTAAQARLAADPAGLTVH
jgi:hypothetical protein